MTAAAVRTRSPETTELGCRSLMRVFDDPQFATKIDQQLYSWCKQKNWDADLLTGPGVVDVAPGVTASLVRDQRQDGSTIERCRFHQDEGHGIWITEVTTLVDRDNSGWVWTDVYQPEGREARIPRLVGNILEVIDAFDGHHRITPTPIRADVDDVDEIYAAILDDDRRGFLFLAGSDDTMAIPQANWADYVKRLTGRTRGLANTYVLSPRATLALNTRLPESHRIREWSIRTFLPKPELDDPRDGVRHRVLSTGRIVNDTEYHLRDLLARAACRHSATTAIPRELVRIDRRLRELLDEAIVDGSAVRGPSTPVEAPHQTEESRVVAPTTTVPSTVTHRGSDTEPPSTSRLLAALRSVVTKVVGTADVTVEAIGRLGELAADSLMHEKNLRAVRERIHTIQSERNALEDRNIELAARAQDGQDELAGIRIELSATEAQLRHLRSELAKLDRGEVSWVPTAVSSDNPPD